VRGIIKYLGREKYTVKNSNALAWKLLWAASNPPQYGGCGKAAGRQYDVCFGRNRYMRRLAKGRGRFAQGFCRIET
jgi:hypothetical protein